MKVLVDRVNDVDGVARHHARMRPVSQPQIRPFTQKDYFRMMAFFTNTDYEVRKLGTAPSLPRRPSICRRPSRKPSARKFRARSTR